MASPIMVQLTSRVVEVATQPGQKSSIADTQPQFVEFQEKSAAVSTPSQSVSQQTNDRWLAWKVFGSTFCTIFLAELGDKTQLTTLLMSAESHAPWTVFLGAGAALVTTSLLGVLLGQWIACRVSPRTLEKSAGVVLLFIAILLIGDVLL